MSDNIQSGFRNAIVGVLLGIIFSTILGAISKIPSVPPQYVGIIRLIQVVYLVAGILVILAMESWAFWYLIGWLLGIWIMYSVGLVESWLFVVYAIIGVVVLVVKILRKARHSLSL